MFFYQYIIILLATFIAGLVDSIGGGGGLISLPAYLFIGLPPDSAVLCNKFSASCGTTFSTLNFLKSKLIKLKTGLASVPMSFLGAQFGMRLALSLEPLLLKTLLFVILPFVGIFMLVKKDIGDQDMSSTLSKRKSIILSCIIGGLIGFYDGLFGPGTGTFAIIAYSYFMKYDARHAAGNAKLLNLTSNYSSLAVGLFSDKIIYSVAVPAALTGIAGSFIGSYLAIKKGKKIIRPMMLFVVLLLFINLFYYLFNIFVIRVQ